MKRRKMAMLLSVIFLVASAAGCTVNNDATDITSIQAEESVISIVETASQADSSFVVDETGVTKISMNGSSVIVDGIGAKADGSILRITAGGVYSVSGTLDDGQIIIAAPPSASVELRLNGVNISSTQNAAIYCSEADNLLLVLVDGTGNTLTDSQNYTFADTVAGEPDAALFCKVDLEIGGSGTLVVNGNFNNGIGTKDDLMITGGTFLITAVDHGIRGRDSVTIRDGNFTIKSGSDGIQSNNDEDASKGWILLEGGSYDITAANDGVQAQTDLTVSGGEYKIIAGGGYENKSISTEESYKGLKAYNSLEISGGDFQISSADDAIHSNNNIIITDGAYSLQTGDDAIHGDRDVTISGGNIDITDCYEGIEGSRVVITDGVINIHATDDPLNGAGEAPILIDIQGGSITIDSLTDDGADSNADMRMSGGTLISQIAATGRMTAPIGLHGSLTTSGGTLLGIGNASMGQLASSNSPQACFGLFFAERQSAGTTITIYDAAGTELINCKALYEFQFVMLSSPELTVGETYTVTTDKGKRIEVKMDQASTIATESGNVSASRNNNWWQYN